MSFELTILGSSGGPIEGSNCCILIKPLGITYQNIINNDLKDELLCIDAGSGLAKLSEIVYQESNGVVSNQLLNLYSDSSDLLQYLKVPISYPFKDFKTVSPFEASLQIFYRIKNYLISHPHLDHIHGLVLNSPTITTDNPKQVWGNFNTISALNAHIFNGVVWPNMQEFKLINLNTILFYEEISINKNYSITMFKLSHGKVSSHARKSITVNEHYNFGKHGDDEQRNLTTYLSSAFLIHYKPSNSKILVFGDFESDEISGQSFNDAIWKAITPSIVDRSIAVIILECSNICNGDKLYGHLNPKYVIEELRKLQRYCTEYSKTPTPLKGLNIIVNHVKESNGTYDPRKQILQDLEMLNEEFKLELNFSIALSGISVII